jgi:hypothetical protein
VDILAALPEIEQSVYENSCSVNMQIFVDTDYLAWRMGYPSATDGTFLNESPEKKMAMNRTIQSEVETFITGQSKQHKTLLSLKYYDQNGTMRTAVDFKPVESSVNMGKNIPSSQNASGKLLESFGLDPAMLGSVMSDTKSRGGGSDKEAAMMALQNWLQPHRTNLLFAAEIFMRQMGMPDDVFMGIRDIRNSDDVAMHGGRAFTSDMPIIKK